MIASSAMDGDSYNSTLNLDQFSNFLSHSDEISYSSYYDCLKKRQFELAGLALISLSSVVLLRGRSIFGLILGITVAIYYCS